MRRSFHFGDQEGPWTVRRRHQDRPLGPPSSGSPPSQPHDLCIDLSTSPPSPAPPPALSLPSSTPPPLSSFPILPASPSPFPPRHPPTPRPGLFVLDALLPTRGNKRRGRLRSGARRGRPRKRRVRHRRGPRTAWAPRAQCTHVRSGSAKPRGAQQQADWPLSCLRRQGQLASRRRLSGLSPQALTQGPPPASAPPAHPC